jgi:ketopantoate reductase
MAKIAVVGCGAMGSVYAALMVDAGHEVRAVTSKVASIEPLGKSRLAAVIQQLCHTPTAFREWTLEHYREIARKAMMKNPPA